MRKSDKSQRIELRNALQHVRFQDLALFEIVARHTSLSAAAREGGLKAPFLTKAIQKLETQLGVKLLDRTYQGIALTNDGIEFLQLCKSIMTKMEQTHWRKEGGSFTQPSLITLAGPMFLLTHLVAPVLPGALRQEKMGLRLIEMPSSQMIATATRSHIEAAIHYDDVGDNLDWGQAWRSYPIGTVEWVLCSRIDHPLGVRATEKEISRYPFVTPSVLGPQGFRSVSDNCPIPLKGRLRMTEVSNGEIGLRVVQNTDQLIFIANIQAQEAIRQGKVQIIEVKDWQPLRKTVHLSIHQTKVKQKWLQLTVRALEEGLRLAKAL